MRAIALGTAVEAIAAPNGRIKIKAGDGNARGSLTTASREAAGEPHPAMQAAPSQKPKDFHQQTSAAPEEQAERAC